jgi:crossover junction endodeoxyribonuclease RusA
VMLISLPWPHADLSPNARVHWRTLAAQKSIARVCARYLAIEAGAKRATFPERPAVTVTFHPPDRRKRDIQNVIGSLKAAVDGIADGMGVDDSSFRIRWPDEFGWPLKAGVVVVAVEEAA